MSIPIVPRRGRVYRIQFEPEVTVLGLIVSLNSHNNTERKYIAVLVTADRNVPASLPSWVRLTAGDPAFGHVVVSDIGMVAQDELKEDLGEICMETMLHVERALGRVLGL